MTKGILTDVLNHIIPKGVLNEDEGVVGDLSYQTSLLLTGSMVNATLQDAATMTMGANSNAITPNGIVDELSKSVPV